MSAEFRAPATSYLAAPEPPTLADIGKAASRLDGPAVFTPLVESPLLNDRLDCRLLAKAEVLQRTGSFKFRGAFNRLSKLSEDERRLGVVAYSSGNHAQGVAAAARIVGASATIFMPKDAPAMKVLNTRRYGAEVRFYDRATESREEMAEALAHERGAVLVRPYEDPDVIAGQGTVGLEIASDARRLGIRLDAVLVPCGGGGLSAGTALAIAETNPETRVYSVEPQGFDDMARSLAAGARKRIAGGGHSMCDALLMPEPGALTFAVAQGRLAGGLAVGDAATRRAMVTVFADLNLVVEPSGAVALAAVLAEAIERAGRTLCVVLTGGNVDPEIFSEVLASEGWPPA
ncbi:MAG: threonine/serine dehydratase [Rhodospirillales bacterium]|nr:threonine/serine dehydratase [Rhodospirillales bacterium]